MADLVVTNTFISGQTVSAAAFNTNYADIALYVNARNSGSSTWDGMSSMSASNVPMTTNNSTGTQSIMKCMDNGTTVYEVHDGGIIDFSYQEVDRTYKSSDQASVSGLPTKITFDVADQPGSSMGATGTFTAPANGKYFIGASILLPQNQSSPSFFVEPICMIYKNGAEYTRRKYFYSQRTATVNVYDILSLASGDTIEIYVDPTLVAGNGPYLGGSALSKFTVTKLS